MTNAPQQQFLYWFTWSSNQLLNVKKLFSVSKEWVRSWSHAFLITYQKTLTKKLLAVRPEKATRSKKKKKKTRKATAKLFALNANAINMIKLNVSIIFFDLFHNYKDLVLFRLLENKKLRNCLSSSFLHHFSGITGNSEQKIFYGPLDS